MFASVKDTTAPTPNSLFAVAVEAPLRNVKLAIPRNALRAELELLSEVVEAKQAYALFHHLLLEANTARVRLRAIGLYNTLQCDVEADVQQTGSFCLPAKKLADIVRHRLSFCAMPRKLASIMGICIRRIFSCCGRAAPGGKNGRWRTLTGGRFFKGHWKTRRSR